MPVYSDSINDGVLGALLPSNKRRIISQYGLPFTINPAPNGSSDFSDRIHVSGYVNSASGGIGAFFEDSTTPSVSGIISDNYTFTDTIIPVFPVEISDDSTITDSNNVIITTPISSNSEFSDTNSISSITSNTISDNNIEDDTLSVRTITSLQETQDFTDSNFSYITTTNVDPTVLNDTNSVIFNANVNTSSDSNFSQTLNSGIYTSIVDNNSNLTDSIIVKITVHIDESISSVETTDVLSIFEETIVEGNQYQYFGDHFGNKYLDYWGDYFGYYNHFNFIDSQSAAFPMFETQLYIDAIDVEGIFYVSNEDATNYVENINAALSLTESESINFQEITNPILLYNTNSLETISFGDALDVNMISHVSISETVEIDIPQTVRFISFNEFAEYCIYADDMTLRFMVSMSDNFTFNDDVFRQLSDSISDNFKIRDHQMIAHIRKIKIQRCHVKQHTPLKVYHYIIDGYKYKLKDNIILFLDDRLLNKTSTLNNKLLAQKIMQELATIVKWDHGVVEFQDDRIGSVYINLDDNSIHNYSDGHMNIIINGIGNKVDDNHYVEYEDNDTVILFKNNVITKVDLTYIDEM